MNACPPKPGLTDMMRMRSTRSITFSMRLDRRAGIERDAGLLAERADRLQRAVHVRAGLDMHRDDVGAGLGEGFEIGIARRDHQVRVEHLLRVRAHRRDRRRARTRCSARNARPSRRDGSSRRRPHRPRALPRRAWRNRRPGSRARSAAGASISLDKSAASGITAKVAEQRAAPAASASRASGRSGIARSRNRAR